MKRSVESKGARTVHINRDKESKRRSRTTTPQEVQPQSTATVDEEAKQTQASVSDNTPRDHVSLPSTTSGSTTTTTEVPQQTATTATLKSPDRDLPVSSEVLNVMRKTHEMFRAASASRTLKYKANEIAVASGSRFVLLLVSFFSCTSEWFGLALMTLHMFLC